MVLILWSERLPLAEEIFALQGGEDIRMELWF
jgi:hypothetical protein